MFLESSHTTFLEWLKNRLIYKHGYASNDLLIGQLDSFKESLCKDINISDDQLDSIIVKYFADFYLDYSEDMKLGFTQDQRNKFRSAIRFILKDIDNLIKNSNTTSYSA